MAMTNNNNKTDWWELCKRIIIALLTAIIGWFTGTGAKAAHTAYIAHPKTEQTAPADTEQNGGSLTLAAAHYGTDTQAGVMGGSLTLAAADIVGETQAETAGGLS